MRFTPAACALGAVLLVGSAHLDGVQGATPTPTSPARIVVGAHPSCKQAKAVHKSLLDLGKAIDTEIIRFTDLPQAPQKKIVKKITVARDGLQKLAVMVPKDMAPHVNREFEYQKVSLVFIAKGNDNLRSMLNRAAAIVAPPNGDAAFDASIQKLCGFYLDR